MPSYSFGTLFILVWIKRWQVLEVGFKFRTVVEEETLDLRVS